MTEETKRILDTIQRDIKEELKGLQTKLELIENFNENSAATPELFQLLCDTPIRGTKLLERVVQNTFPMATNIHTSPNYIYFRLYDVLCELPTWRCKNACINMDWWKDDRHFDSSLQAHLAQELIDHVYPILQKYSGEVMLHKQDAFHELDIEAFKQEWEESALYQQMIAEQEERE